MFLTGVCCGCIPTLLVLIAALLKFRCQFDRLTREAVSTGAQFQLVMIAHEAEKSVFETAQSELWSVIHAQNDQLAKAARTVELQTALLRHQDSVLREHDIRLPEQAKPSLH